jgi:hypothetical protein
MFYIFMVWNKKMDSHTKVYDLQKNVLYEDGDVEVKLLDTGIGLSAFIESAKDMVTKKTYASATTYGNYGGYNNYGRTNTPTGPYNPTKEKSKTTVSGVRHGYQTSLYGDDWEDDYSAFGYRRGV